MRYEYSFTKFNYPKLIHNNNLHHVKIVRRVLYYLNTQNRHSYFTRGKKYRVTLASVNSDSRFCHCSACTFNSNNLQTCFIGIWANSISGDRWFINTKGRWCESVYMEWLCHTQNWFFSYSVLNILLPSIIIVVQDYSQTLNTYECL